MRLTRTPFLAVVCSVLMVSCDEGKTQSNAADAADATEETGEAGDTVDSGSNPEDSGGEDVCSSCVVGELPSIGSVPLIQYPPTGEDCTGICVRKGNTSEGRCIAPEEADKTCDYKAGGYFAEVVDPELATEPFAILESDSCVRGCEWEAGRRPPCWAEH